MRNKTIKLKDGRNLGYADFGDVGAAPLFYFHGWPGCRLNGSEIESAAKKLGVRVISMDRAGYGSSDYKEDRILLQFPEDVLELADKLKINKFAVMGVSGGGPYAAVCAYKIAKRITRVGIVVGLAPTYIPGILSGLGFFKRVAWMNYPRIYGLKTFSVCLTFLTGEFFTVFDHFLFPAKADQALMTKDLKEQMRASFKEAFRQGIKGVLRDLKLYTEEWGFKVSEIKTKVYLWYGDADENVPLAMGRYYAKQIPNSKLVIYKNEGHLCRIKHQEEILRKLI